MTSASGSALPEHRRPSTTAVWLTPTSARARLAAAVGVCSAVMLAVGLWGLNRGAVWRDEVATYVAASRAVPQLWLMLHHVDAVHGFYYLGMHGWLTMGHGEVWMRIPSVVASVVSAGLIAALGARLGGIRTGLTAGLLFAAMPLVSFYAQEARPFALVSAAVLAATYLLVLALSRGRGWWPGYAAAVAVAAFGNEFALLVLVAHAVTLWITRAERGTWLRWAGCAAFCGATVAPLAYLSTRQSDQVSWLRTPTSASLGNLAGLFLGPRAVTTVVMVVLLVAAVALARPHAGLELVAVAAPLAMVPPVVLLLASFIDPLFHPRYVLYAAAGVPLWGALGLNRLASVLTGSRRRWLAGLVTAVVLLAVVFTEVPQLRFVRTPASRVDDLTAAAAAVRSNARSGDSVLFMPGVYRLVELGYPRDFAGLTDIALLAGPNQSGSLTGRDLDLAQIGPAMRGVDRLWVVGRTNFRVEPGEEKTLAKQAALAAYFQRVRVVHVPGIDVALYQRR